MNTKTSILFLLVVLLTTSCERKYYTITKDELDTMERRVIKIESRLMDLLYSLPEDSKNYTKAEEAKEQADALLNDISAVIDADRNY